MQNVVMDKSITAHKTWSLCNYVLLSKMKHTNVNVSGVSFCLGSDMLSLCEANSFGFLIQVVLICFSLFF